MDCSLSRPHPFIHHTTISFIHSPHSTVWSSPESWTIIRHYYAIKLANRRNTRGKWNEDNKQQQQRLTTSTRIMSNHPVNGSEPRMLGRKVRAILIPITMMMMIMSSGKYTSSPITTTRASCSTCAVRSCSRRRWSFPQVASVAVIPAQTASTNNNGEQITHRAITLIT